MLLNLLLWDTSKEVPFVRLTKHLQQESVLKLKREREINYQHILILPSPYPLS